jgi:D-glycero-D-manno-heptose 1,7-bisphosphate phosphatase
MQNAHRKAVFLDRDGVLNVDLGYTYKATDLRLVPGMVDGLKTLAEAGYVLVMITNQSGVARGLYSMDQVHEFNDEMIKQIQNFIPDFRFDSIMICPHHPQGSVPEFSIDCDCRKPGIKLVTTAAAHLGLDLSKSWLVGDKDIDVECAKNAGMRGIQVTHGGKQYPQSKYAFAKAPTLKDAAEIILKNSF